MSRVYPWHGRAWQALDQAFQRGQLPHALLLSGPAGLAKGQFARAAARHVLCQAAPGRARPCGECRSCRLEAAGNHPDLYEVHVAEDRQSITIAQIRDLCEALSLHSLAAGYKVAIIAPAERMSIPAANSLLKTLEEPTAGTLLVLVSARPARLPATVRSRCLKLHFAAPESAAAVEWLRERHAEADWGRLLALANGAPLAALELHAAGFLAVDAQLSRDLGAILEGREDPLAVAARWRRHDLPSVLDWLHRCVCDLVRSRLAGKPLRSAEHAVALQRRLRASTLISLFAYLDRVQAVRGLADTTMNAQLALEDLLIPWSEGLSRAEPEL